MAGSGIYPIRGWGCLKCRAQMIGFSKQKALEHYGIPMDDPLPTGLVLPDLDRPGLARIIVGEGKIVQEGPPQLVHGYSQPLIRYSFETNSLFLRTRAIHLNSRATKISLNEGTLSFLPQEKYEEVKSYFKGLTDSAGGPIDFKRTLPCLEKTWKP